MLLQVLRRLGSAMRLRPGWQWLRPQLLQQISQLTGLQGLALNFKAYAILL